MPKTVYKKLSIDLEKYFLENDFPFYLPGIRFLCKQFGVSKNTMSKALNVLQKRGLISIEPQKGITLIKTYRNGDIKIKFHAIGIAGFCDFVQQNFLDLLNRKYSKYGFALVGVQISSCNTIYNRKYLQQLPVDGMILLNSTSMPWLLDLFYTNNIPLIGCPVPGYEHLIRIESDHYTTYYTIYRELIALGHSRILFVHFAPDSAFDFYIKRILDAIQDAMQENFDDELIWLLDAKTREEFYQDDGKNLHLQMLNKFSNMKSPPTVIVAEQTLCNSLKSFYEMQGMKIPDDISIYAIQYPATRDPFFSAAVLREDLSVEIAVRKMISILKGKSVKTEEILIPVTFCNGRSVKDISDNNK